jgi:hypothetical protein
MTANKEEIRRALTALIEPDAVAEIRIMGVKDGNYEANYSGYFNDIEKMVDCAARYSGRAPAVYITLQKCKSALLARSANTLKKQKKQGATTSDLDIEKYCWFPIDCDAVRPAGISSTDEEHEAAIKKSRDIFKYLGQMGWPEPIAADSGNGGHLCYKINVPITKDNSKEIQEVIKLALLALAQKFTDKVVDIDRSVHNPSRIWKLYGTMAKKGDETEDRKHRMAKILYIPKEIKEVDFEKIKLLASMFVDDKAKKQTVQKSITGVANNSESTINPVEWCAKHGIAIQYDSQYQDAKKYVLEECPFNSTHKESAIFQNENGAISFKCFHASCQNYGWQELRQKFEPGCYERHSPKPDYQQNRAPAKKQSNFTKIKPRINVQKDKNEMFDELMMQESGESVTIDLPWKRVSDGAKMLYPGSLTILAGPQKAGKSFFVANIIKHLEDAGETWAYLPLEDKRKEWMWRMLAIIDGDYRLIYKDKETVSLRTNAMLKYESAIDSFLTKVTENPRVDHVDENGDIFVPEVAHEAIIDWIKEMAPTHRVLFVDPISQIDGKGRETFNAESWFIRQALAIVLTYGISLVFITHTVKRPGAMGAIPLGAEDVQGSSMFAKLAHTTLMLDRMEGTEEGEVFSIGGTTKTVNYDRIVTIAAARNGKGTGWRIAFSQDKDKPAFHELGILVPQKKQRRN